MEVNFLLPASVPRGVPFDVLVTAKHTLIGATVDITLAQMGGAGWAAPTVTVPAHATPGAPDGTATAVFTVVLGSPGRANLCATAEDRSTNDIDSRTDHVDVI